MTQPAKGNQRARELLLRDLSPAMTALRSQAQRTVEEGYGLEEARRVELAVLRGGGSVALPLESRKRSITRSSLRIAQQQLEELVEGLLAYPDSYGVSLVEEIND